MDRRSRLAPVRAFAARAAALALLVAGAPAPPAGAVQGACATDEDQEMLALVNAERAARRLAPLALDVRLNAAARRHVEDMREHCFLSHEGSDGSTAKERMADAGYPDGMAEVAASGGTFPAAFIVDAWMDSTKHRAILTNENARHIGLASGGYAPGCPSAFWVGDTGRAPDSEFLDSLCCDEPGATPQCVPEPGAVAASAALAALATLARGRRPGATASRRDATA